jgi:hypothetical protein
MLLVHDESVRQQFPIFETLVEPAQASGMIVYRPGVLVASALLASLLLMYFVRLKPSRSPEEALEEAIARTDRKPQPEGDGPDAAFESDGADQKRQRATTTA